MPRFKFTIVPRNKAPETAQYNLLRDNVLLSGSSYPCWASHPKQLRNRTYRSHGGGGVENTEFWPPKVTPLIIITKMYMINDHEAHWSDHLFCKRSCEYFSPLANILQSLWWFLLITEATFSSLLHLIDITITETSLFVSTFSSANKIPRFRTFLSAQGTW